MVESGILPATLSGGDGPRRTGNALTWVVVAAVIFAVRAEWPRRKRK